MNCGLNLPSGKVVSSIWTFYVNDFDGVMTFECQDGNVVTGIGGYHSNDYENRRDKFRCTFLRSKRRGVAAGQQIHIGMLDGRRKHQMDIT